MTVFLNDRTARRRTVAFGILMTISLVLMAFSSSPPVQELQHGIAFAFRPLQAAVDGTARGMGAMVATIGEISTLRRTNEELARENAALRAANQRAKEIERENTTLTGLLQVRSDLAYTTVAGTVIGRESSPFRRVVTLDIGSAAGVTVGDVVVADGGALVGRVTSVTGNSTTVLLINDTSSTVIGQLGGSQATGAIVGQLGGVLAMQNIDSTERVLPNDAVTTAGVDLGGGVRSPFPKGLVVGTVVDVQRDANAVVQTAFVQPAVNLDKLEFALVITSYQGGLPPVGGSPAPSPAGSSGPGASPSP
jgi:rod shape-determining protein MreC